MTTITLSIEEYEILISRISQLEKENSELERAYHTQVDIALSKSRQYEEWGKQNRELRQAAKEVREGMERMISKMEIRSLSTTE